MRRRNRIYFGPIAYFIAWIGVQAMPRSVYTALTGLIPIEGLPDSALRLGLTIVIAGLLFLAIVAGSLIWESRQSAADTSGDAPPTGDDQQS